MFLEKFTDSQEQPIVAYSDLELPLIGTTA